MRCYKLNFQKPFMFRILPLALGRVNKLIKMPFYAVRVGRTPGIYPSWSECKQQVDGVPARFKKFTTLEEAESFMSVENPGDHNRKPFVARSEKKKKKSTHQSEQHAESSKRKHEDDDDESKRQKTDSSRTVVYTDGCCTHNGRKNACAGVGVFWGDGDHRNVSEPLEGPQTNQRAELNAAITALEVACANDINKVEIRTDSMYTLNAVTSWMSNWKRNGFRTANGTDVKNKEDIVKLDNLCQKVDVQWTHVRGHTNVYGNEKADELARLGSVKRN